MKNTCKVYEENGIRYQFEANELLIRINQRKHNLQNAGKKVTKAAIVEELAEKCYVSTEAIKNWMYGHNGPSELEQVKTLGEYFETDYHQLLKKEEGQMTNSNEKNNGTMNEAQVTYTKERVREIYRSIINYIDRCRYYYYELMPLEEEDLKDENYRQSVLRANTELRTLFNTITLQLKYSMLDIPEGFYKKVYDYLWVELNDFIELIADSQEDNYTEDETTSDYDDYYDYTYNFLEKYFDTGYEKELRELLEDYIVK